MAKFFHGLSAVPGIGIGNLLIYSTWHLTTWGGPAELAVDPQQEWQQFCVAIEQVDQQLTRLATQENLSIAELLSAQRLILQDQTFLDAVQQAIFQDHLPSFAATEKVIGQLAELFRNLGDDYFAGRATDILDIGQRLLKAMGLPMDAQLSPEKIPTGTILVARDITFSEISQLPLAHIVGIVLAESTPTAHSAILARAAGIPMLCTVGEEILQLPSQQSALLDGQAGYLVVEPTARELSTARARQQALAADQAVAMARAQEVAHTQDGFALPVLANVHHLDGVAQLHSCGADGIGLLRTEYFFDDHLELPTVDEQVALYRHIVHQLAGRPLTVRAFDIGGDKLMPYLWQKQEANPFLGLRGIRLLLEQPALLLSQYEALWQIAIEMARGLIPSCSLRFLLPMISTVAELQAVHTLLSPIAATARAQLPTLAGQTPPTIQMGAMIEVPSAALLAEHMTPFVDFFSIGTNDLAQYTLATDRTNSTVAAIADPLHPAVLQLIQRSCQAGAAAGISVSLCGEIGGDPLAIPLLIGLGLQEVSVPLPAVPLVKAAVRLQRQVACQALATAALQCADADAVRTLLVNSL